MPTIQTIAVGFALIGLAQALRWWPFNTKSRSTSSSAKLDAAGAGYRCEIGEIERAAKK